MDPLLIGLLIVLAMSEWREARAKEQIKKLVLEVNKSKRAMDRILDRTAKLQSYAQEAKIAADHAYKAAMESRASSVDAADKLLEVKASVDTILREYQVNGVPMGYERQKFDAIEGL